MPRQRKPTVRDLLPPWIEVGAGNPLPLIGQLVMACGHTYRPPPNGTHYGLVRYVGGVRGYQWRGMDGIALRDTVYYWRELSQYELPFEL